jgi:hypothetical protein
MIASDLHESCSRSTRSHQCTEITVPSYDFIEGIEFFFNMFKSSRNIFGRRRNFFRCGSDRIEYRLQPSNALSSKAKTSIPKIRKCFAQLNVLSISASTLAFNALDSRSKRSEFFSKVARVLSSSLLNFPF